MMPAGSCWNDGPNEEPVSAGRLVEHPQVNESYLRDLVSIRFSTEALSDHFIGLSE